MRTQPAEAAPLPFAGGACGVRCSESKPRACHCLAVWLRAGHPASLRLSFLFRKMGGCEPGGGT